MKIIFRKNDSATSLVLFIYNNYYTKTAKDSLKLSSLLEILKVFNKSETAIRMSLSRAVKAGILINSRNDGEVIYTLSAFGKQSINLWNEGVMNYWKRFKLRNLSWDGRWHLINIEFTNDKKQHREIIDKFQQFGFALTNKNTFISPYAQKDEVNKIIQEYSIEESVIEIIGEVTIRKNMMAFLEEVYHLDNLKEKYQGFVNQHADKLSKILKLTSEEKFISEGKALQMLNEIGWKFFEIAADDAVLPIQLYPHWAGDEAAIIMKEVRKSLLEASNKYLDRFE